MEKRVNLQGAPGRGLGKVQSSRKWQKLRLGWHYQSPPEGMNLSSLTVYDLHQRS